MSRHYAAGQRIAQEQGGGEGGDHAEMREARRKAHDLQRRYDVDETPLSEIERENVQRYETLSRKHPQFLPDLHAARQRLEERLADEGRRLRPPQTDRGGTWEFIALRNDSGDINGYRVLLDGKMVGMLVHRGNDLLSLSTSRDEDELAPSADQIMAAFIRVSGDRR